jgi:pyruvate formate lyase activating enzyme
LLLNRTEQEGLVFDIQRYSLHDGPGIRVLVFLKSCPLRCLWCSNPESQSNRVELIVDLQRCRGCGLCAEICPHRAISCEDDRYASYDAALCDLCGLCIQACPNRARRFVGWRMTVSQVMDEVVRDMPFSRRSGGGITLGGGEPTGQPEFAHDLLACCREQGMHTAVETCGSCGWPDLEDISTATDLFLYDIKVVDPAKHMQFTGVDNHLILDNLARLARIHNDIVVRYPLVPGFNDSADDIGDLLNLLKGVHGLNKVEVLPYHRFGESKYAMLGREYPLKGLEVPSESEVKEIVEQIQSGGLDCREQH